MGVDSGLDYVIEEAGDGEGADAASRGGEGGEVFAFADFFGEIAF